MAERIEDSYDVVFEEVQGIPKIWTLIIIFAVVATAVILGWMSYEQLYLGKPWGNKPASDEVVVFLDIILFLTCIVLPLLVLKLKLVVKVVRDVLIVQMRPLVNKRYLISDIETCESVTYRPIRDYGGWGIRYSFTKRSWAYNITGNKGVEIKFKGGRKLLIGSQRADELAAAICNRL